MSVELKVPALGESVVEATVGSWLKQVGERVEAGDPLVELETDKVNVDITAEHSGVLRQILHQPGATVRPGEVLAMLERPGDPQQPGASAEETAVGPIQSDAIERPHASPLARKLADEHQIDLAKVEGSGTAGRVTRQDIDQFLARQQPETPAPASATQVVPVAAPRTPALGEPAPVPRGEQRVRMSRRRQTIAARLLEAQRTAAILTTFNEADMSAVISLRARQRDAFKARHAVGLGFMSFFTKAVVGALKSNPRLNAEIQGDEIVLKQYYDIGIAVGVEDGLVVPVVRDADRKSFAEIEREIADFGARARANTLTLADLRGGTFTITNGGVFGSLLSTPILSPPQVGILGMHAIQERPVVRDGQIVIRAMMNLALSYDHRIVDGREAVQFLVKVKQLIEDPGAMLLDS